MYDVSETSALVLLWSNPSLYDSASAKKFLDCINLDSGRPFQKEFDQLLNHAKPVEEMSNRKYGVNKFSKEFLSICDDAQVIVLGAGLDPRTLDIAEKFSSTMVFDVDMDNREIKKQITGEINGPKNIVFCTADVSNAEKLTKTLKESGWDDRKATLIIAEGITYYVPKEKFKATLEALKTPKGGLVFEYSIPNEEIEGPDDKTNEYKLFFDKIQQLLGLSMPLCCYSKKEMASLSKSLGGELEANLNQAMLERERTGGNIHYTNQSGCVHVAFIRFK